jgi:hypothetical protein
MRAAAVLRALWIAAGFALLLGLVREPLLRLMPAPRELPRLDRETGLPWIEGGFLPGRGFDSIARGRLPEDVQTATSGIFGDDWQGRSETAWFRAKPAMIHVAVAGYPRHRGCALWAEFRSETGAITRVDCAVPDPREEWNVWEVRRPAGTTAVRLVAEDRTEDNCGWLAFSHPYRAWPGVVTAAFLQFQLLCTLALVLVCIWLPGLLWRPVGASPEWRAVCLLGAGPLLLAAGGLALWLLGGAIPPRLLGPVLVGTLWLALGRGLWRRGFTLDDSPAFQRTLLVSALLALAVVAKSAYSRGPAGELFRGTISRNLTVADRIDSRFSFYTVQAIARHFGPAAPETERYFQPWTFFSRGPLAGLAAAPVVFASGGHPPREHAEQRWSPFDRQGFAAFRVTMIVLASGIVVAFFAVLRAFVVERWALIGAGLLALSPFGIHEVMFTWPKWVATAWLALSFLLTHSRRPDAAGLALGVGFLFHPLVLLWGPWLAVWCAGRCERRPAAIALGVLRLAGATALVAVPWVAAGAMAPHLPESVFAGQGDFMRYWTLADREAATWATWWHTRWMNFANTFIPFHGYLSAYSFDHFRAHSPYGGTGPLEKFAALWWTSLPLGLGLGLWLAGLAALTRAVRVLRAAAGLLVVAPALVISAYWGMDPLGWMRECGHPLALAIIGLVCVIAANRDSGWQRALAHPAAPWLQLPETLLMLWLTTLAGRELLSVDFAHLDAWCLALNALALGLVAWVLSRARLA